MTAASKIESVVREFVVKLEDEVRADIRARLEQGLSNGGRHASRSNGLAKGEKRDPSYITALEEKFVAFVAKHPGLRIEQINKELGTSTKELMLPIRKAIAAKVVKTEGERRATKYFAGGGGKAKHGKKSKKST
jgi:hypothetical protein